MAIIRSKRQAHYTIIDNRVFAKNQLSFEAMGLLGYLLSKPDNWTVSVAELVGVTQDTRKQSKNDAIYTILNELIAKGFVERKKNQSGKVDYTVYDCPQVSQIGKIPNRENPKQGDSLIGKIPNRENPDLNNNGDKEVTITELPPYPQNAETETQDCANALADGKPSTGECAAAPMTEAQPKAAKKQSAPVADIIAAYNEILGDRLPKATETPEHRKRAIATRWRELLGTYNPYGKLRYDDTEGGLRYWRALFAKARTNPHWLGENDRNWRADLDWFMKPRNFTKLVEFIPQSK